MDHSVLHARISLRKHLCFVSVSWWKFIEKCSSANETKWGKSYFVVLLCTVAKSCEIPCKQRWYKYIQRFSAHTVSALCPATITSNTLIQLRKTPNSLKSHAFIISLNDLKKNLYRVSAFCWVCFQKSKVCNKINTSLYFLVRKHIIDAVPSSICGVKIRGLSNYPFSKTGQANQEHLRPRSHWSAAGPPRISQASEHNVRGLDTEMMVFPWLWTTRWGAERSDTLSVSVVNTALSFSLFSLLKKGGSNRCVRTFNVIIKLFQSTSWEGSPVVHFFPKYHYGDVAL